MRRKSKVDIPPVFSATDAVGLAWGRSPPPSGPTGLPCSPQQPQTPQSTPEPSWGCSSPGDRDVTINLPPSALEEAAQEHPVPLSPRLQGQAMASGIARGVQPLQAPLTVCPLRPEHPPVVQNHPQAPWPPIPSRNPRHSHHSWVSEAVPEPRRCHPGMGAGGASTISGCWKQKVQRKSLVCPIFWTYILKGKSLDICWGGLSSPGVRWEGRWERKGERRGVERRWTGEREG